MPSTLETRQDYAFDKGLRIAQSCAEDWISAAYFVQELVLKVKGHTDKRDIAIVPIHRISLPKKIAYST